MKLEKWRDQIDSIDCEIVRLINHRVKIAGKIGVLKAKSGLPVTDLTREKEILQNICANTTNVIENESIVNIYRRIIQESKEVQMEIARDIVDEERKIY